MDFHSLRLSNGIRVEAALSADARTVSLQIWFSCGARTEAKDEGGLAHFNEHMFFKGGRDFPDAKSVKEELWALGSQYNGVTSHEFVCYYITTRAPFFRRAAHLFSDILCRARMDPGDIETERGVIIQELRRSRGDDEDYADVEFAEFFYGDHPLGKELIGSEENILRFSVDDVRGYKDRFYGPPNAVIAVAGGVAIDEVHEALESCFGGIPEKEKVAWLPFRPPKVLTPAAVITRQVEQAQLRIGTAGLPLGDPKDQSFSLLAKILLRRLWFALREERGLVYGVSVLPVLHSDTGMLAIDAGTETAQGVVTEAIANIFREMAAIKAGDVSGDEVQKIKTAYHTEIDLAAEGTGLLGRLIGINTLLLGKWKTFEEIHQEIEEVGRDDIVRLANGLWPEEAVRSLLLTASFPDYEAIFCTLRRSLGQ